MLVNSVVYLFLLFVVVLLCLLDCVLDLLLVVFMDLCFFGLFVWCCIGLLWLVSYLAVCCGWFSCAFAFWWLFGCLVVWGFLFNCSECVGYLSWLVGVAAGTLVVFGWFVSRFCCLIVLYDSVCWFGGR